MPRSGLNTKLVVDAAARLADAEGLENLTLKRLAEELDIRSPSLFSHIDGLVAARSGFNCAVDYRSVVMFTRAENVADAGVLAPINDKA